MCPGSRARQAEADIARQPDSRASWSWAISSPSSARSSRPRPRPPPRRAERMPPRGLRPSGLILVDKAPGPSSFGVVRDIRARTGARTGHAGTLDPFASGLLLVLSGGATRLAPWLVGLDKRYLTEIDLRS